jgi:hypothetical protein
VVIAATSNPCGKIRSAVKGTLDQDAIRFDRVEDHVGLASRLEQAGTQMIRAPSHSWKFGEHAEHVR